MFPVLSVLQLLALTGDGFTYKIESFISG